MKGYVKKGIRNFKVLLEKYWKKILMVVGIFITLAVLLVQGIRTGDNFSGIETWDDQRSTLWPVLASMVITMLGSLITTYVFLKEALDRTVDEKPYYGVVINEYRTRIMKHLWRYLVAIFILMAFVIIMYSVFYFGKIRTNKRFRIIIVALYVISMVYSGVVLRKCIDINKGLFTTAKQLIKARTAKSRELLQMKPEKIREIHEETVGQDERMEKWLQVELRDASYSMDKEKFVSRFSEWERFLMLLLEDSKGFLKEKSITERITTAVMDGMKIFEQDEDMEKQDANANGWSMGAYQKIRSYQEKNYIGKEMFCSMAMLLSEYRDLLKVQMETGQNERTVFYIEDASNELAGLFALFILELSTNVFRILPKIEIFLPAGRFQCANFYNTRFENSAFRSASFKDSVFSRSKISNSNFGMALFQNCEFFSVDSRNCSMSNVLFDLCNLRESIFEDVDFTGAYVKKCNLEKAVFHDCILSNMEIEESKFYQNNFTNSKIWNITLRDIPGETFRECDFSDSDISNVRICIKKEKRKWKSPDRAHTLESRKYLEFLAKEDIADSFWSDQETITDIRTAVNDFQLGGRFFRGFRIEGEIREKKRNRTRCVWSDVEEEAVIIVCESVFKNAKIRDARFYRVNLDQSVFTYADMKGAYFLSVHMPGCILDGANLRESLLWAVNLQSAVLTDAILFKAVCKMVNFEDAALSKIHASKAEMFYCSFERSDCSGIDLTKALIDNCSFRDAILTNGELTDARFCSVDFENCIADGMLSAYSIFTECTLRNAYLKESCFNYTVFRACDFSLANFNDSTVTNVEFHDCNFEESNFRRTCFVNAYFSGNMKMKAELFDGCTFIRPKFMGSNKGFEEELRARNTAIIE